LFPVSLVESYLYGSTACLLMQLAYIYSQTTQKQSLSIVFPLPFYACYSV